MDHAMSLLCKLHKNECDSFLCVRERAPEHPTLIMNLPPPTTEQVPPSCLQPRLWEEQVKQEPPGHVTSHHHNNLTNDASPGKAPNGTLGSRLYDKCTNDASPDNATNGTLGVSSHYNATSLHCLARHRKAENPRSVDSPTSGLTSSTMSGPSLANYQKAENPFTEPTDQQPKIWPKGNDRHHQVYRKLAQPVPKSTAMYL